MSLFELRVEKRILTRIKSLMVAYFNRLSYNNTATDSLGEIVVNPNVTLGRVIGLYESLQLCSAYEWQLNLGNKSRVSLTAFGQEILVVTAKGIEVDYIDEIYN